MAARIQALDWARSALGSPGAWPQSLRTVLRIMLGSRYAMWLGWGPELVFFCNDAYAPTLGEKQSWALGASARDVWTEIWRDVGPRAQSVLETGEATWDEALLLFLERHGFPEETYHTFSYSPVPDDDGAIGGMLCVVTEETERVIGERRLRTLRELAASTTGAKSADDVCRMAAASLGANPQDLPFALVYLADEPGRTARLAAATGLEPGATAAPAVVPLEGCASGAWPLAELLDARAPLVCEVSRLAGEIRAGPWPEPILSAMLLPLGQAGPDATPLGWLVAGVSTRRPFDEGYRGFLELVAGQVGNALTEGRAYEEERRRAEALAELDRAKIAFFSNVSHEFRTPLTLMLGPLADLLGDGALSPPEHDLVTIVQRNAQRLLKLVNTLLDFSRIEAGRVQAAFEPVDLASFTAELASVFRSAIEKAGLRLVLDCAPLADSVFVDRDMWEKIVLNLVSNAFKFTFDGEIRVTTQAADGHAVLTVADTGTGIPEADLPHVFDRFHRVEHASGRTHEGSGIGLSLVQELARLHGGTVSVESALGRGTTFTVAVPLGRDHLAAEHVRHAASAGGHGSTSLAFVEEALRWLPADAATPSGSPSPEAPRATVLLADDNADMRAYVRRLLADDYDVVAVADGVAALDAALERRPDVILTDVMMPRIDGFALLARLRENPRTASIPVIMVSARADEEARVEGLAAGADDYMIKPFSAKELLARVGGTLALATVRRDALGREARLRAETATVLDSITDGFIALDATFRCTRANTQAERILGRSRDEMSGRTPWEAFPEARDSEIERTLRQAMTERSPRKIETWFAPWSRWFELDVYPTPDGGLAIYFRDVSDRKAALDALRDADRRKDEFLALLAHELRNPLAPLRNGLEVLRLAGVDAGSAADARAMMERQLFHLVRLIDDLLDISRITRNKLELRRERIALADVVSTALETARPVVEGAGHELTVRLPPEPVVLDADLTRIAQVLSNLLINSAKYTPPRGRIGLVAERDDDEVRIVVHDTGIGIPRAALPSIFDMFSQVDRMTGTSGGLGIGLAIVKGLVEMHDGRVEAHSDGPGAGSTFVIHLPLPADEAMHASSAAAAARSETGSRALRVLVVDDNVDSAESMRMMLALLGYEAQTAHDGVSAFATAEAFRPEVVFMDIGMPRLNGLEATQRIRREAWGRDMVIIAVTGWGQESDRLSSKEAGCDGHLIKPVDPASLETLLATYAASGTVAATERAS